MELFQKQPNLPIFYRGFNQTFTLVKIVSKCVPKGVVCNVEDCSRLIAGSSFSGALDQRPLKTPCV